jgi:hypothetical protein
MAKTESDQQRGLGCHDISVPSTLRRARIQAI